MTEQRVAEEQRRTALVRFRGLAGASAGVWEWEAGTNVCSWDDRLRAIHGFLPTEAPTFERWLASVHEEDRPHILARLAAIQQTPGDDEWDEEFRLVHPDGTVVWTQGLARVDRDSDGRMTKMTGLALDITARKAAAERVRLSHERLEHVVGATSEIVYMMSANGQQLDYLAPAAETIYGRPIQAFFDDPTLPLAAVHPDDRSRIEHAYHALLATGRFDETYRIVRPDGSIRWLHDRAHAVQSDGDDVRWFEGVARDVTERKVAEAQRHAAETLAQSVIESAVDGIIVIDARGTIERVNPSGLRLFGYEEAELLGQNIRMLMPSPHREQHDDYLAHHQATGEKRIIGIGREVEGRRKDGSTLPLFLSVSEMPLAEGRRYAGILHDLTALKATEAEVARSHTALHARAAQLERQTQQLRRLASEVTLAEQRAREQLAKTLHDGLQQLLFSARMKLDRSVSKGGDAALVDRARGELADAISAARSLSVELHPPALKAGDFPAALAWLGEWMQRKYRLAVHVSAAPDAVPIQDNVRLLLFESVRELLFNAVKHARVEHATVEVVAANGRLRITVSDEGAGFSPDAALAFTPDYQGGLGLFGIRERVTLLGGRFDVASAPGQGTRFTLEVPLESEPVARVSLGEAKTTVAGARPTGEPSGASRALRILLVDDHPLVREGLRELLTPHPEFEVVGEAADGHEALQQARTLQPDVVLMDVSMPGLDGVEATRRLRSELPHMRIYGLSTEEVTRGRHPIEDAGAVGYFTKTTSTQLLLDRLRAESAQTGATPMRNEAS